MLDTGEPRDFRGYGDNPPKVKWPDNARVAVSFVVNVEEAVSYTHLTLPTICSL